MFSSKLSHFLPSLAGIGEIQSRKIWKDRIAAALTEWYNVNIDLERRRIFMKKRLCAMALLLALAALLSGCGMILVEDTEPVRIGMHMGDKY